MKYHHNQFAMDYQTKHCAKEFVAYWKTRIVRESQFARKTMAGSLAVELTGSLEIYKYRKYIPHLSAGSGLLHAQFVKCDDHDRRTVDTSRTFRGKKSKIINPNLLFAIFGEYSGDEPGVVQALMIKWINEHKEEFDKATYIAMTGKDLNLDTWLVMKSQRTVGDEFALYALCRVFNRHA